MYTCHCNKLEVVEKIADGNLCSNFINIHDIVLSLFYVNAMFI